MSNGKEKIGREEKYRERKMWLVLSTIISRLPCSFLLGVVTSLNFADLMVLQT